MTSMLWKRGSSLGWDCTVPLVLCLCAKQSALQLTTIDAARRLTVPWTPTNPLTFA